MIPRIRHFSSSLLKALNKLIQLDAQERLSTLGTLALIVGLPVLIWWYQGKHIPDSFPKEAKVFNLTGLGSLGKWTLEDVCGYNYWWKSFSPATIEVDDGDLVVLRLKSADATHIFYAPTLGIGPIAIEPGHVEVVTFRAGNKGIHEYYCMAVCGECHFFMRGKIKVGKVNEPELVIASTQSDPTCQHDLHEPTSSSLYDKGKFLFRQKGCTTCHGEGGKGGVPNPNYVKGTVPTLTTLAKTLSLDDKEAAEQLVKLIDESKNFEQLAERSTDIPRNRLVLAKYQIVRDVIEKGRPAARADTTSFEPPLSMPMWHQKLSQRDVDALIVYLLKQQSWEDDKE